MQERIRMGYYDRMGGFMPRLTQAVKYLVLVNTVIFTSAFLLRLHPAAFFGLTPVSFWRGALWQPVTYMFLHGGIFHLLFNMFVLWMFGTALEAIWGPRRFITFYFICGIGAGLLNVVLTPGSPVAIVGSSGAVYGLLMAFGILFPDQLIYVWGIFPIRAKHFVIGLGVIEFFTAISASGSGIAHMAHLGGMLFGLVYMKWDSLQKLFGGWQTEKRRERHLKVVWDRDRERQKIQAEIDELLDKVGRSGMSSLTQAEHEHFRKLSGRLKDLENRE